jgi:hypothetical protein
MFTQTQNRLVGALPSDRGLIPVFSQKPDRRKCPAKRQGHVKETTRPVTVP